MNPDTLDFPLGPQRIVCLTEETTEWLYLLGQERRIVGISGYTVRPRRAREEKPKVSAFTSACSRPFSLAGSNSTAWDPAASR